MNFFYVLNSKLLKQISLVLIAAFFTAWLLYMENLVNLPAFSTSNGPKAVYRGEKDIALTFNIGWGDEKAGPILAELRKENVKSATFFLAGSGQKGIQILWKKLKKAALKLESLVTTM